MSEQAKVTTLTDHEGNMVAPRTTADAVTYGDKTVGGALSEHLGDAVSHMTAAERTKWDGKAEGNHTHTASQIGALPVTGGTLTGALNISVENYATVRLFNTGQNTQGYVQCDGNIYVGAYAPNSNSQTRLIVSNPTLPLAEQLRLAVIDDSSQVTHLGKIYGEHNVTISQSAPTTALANGAIHMVY